MKVMAAWQAAEKKDQHVKGQNYYIIPT